MVKRIPARPAPKPTQAPAPVPVPPENPPAIDNLMPEADDDGMSSLMAELTDGGGEVLISVWRNDKNSKPEYLFKCEADDVSLDELRDKWGGGSFRLYVSRNGQRVRNIGVSVGKPPAAAVVAQPAPDLAAVIREGFAKQAEAMAARAPASIFSGANLPETITAAAAALTAIGGLLRGLMPPPPAPVQSDSRAESRAVDMLLKGIELAKELKGDSNDDDSGLAGLLKTALQSPVIAQALAAAAQGARPPQQPMRQPAAPQALPQPQPQPAAPPVPSPAAAADAQGADAMVSHYVGQLCALADADADPGVYAVVIIDNVPDAVLRSLLAAADPVAELEARHPEITPRRDWFIDLMRELREQAPSPVPPPPLDNEPAG